MSKQIGIEGFEILECLGVGGMATVWKARQESLDRMVAIKVLPSSADQRADDVVRFHEESRTAAKLKHPGIVQVYDAGCSSEGCFYFVMEYISGYTVGDWVRRKARLEESDMLLVAECVADALNYGWSQYGVIHCDIKPDNVLVDADGTVKLTDLGLSRTISAMRHETDSDEILGTPAYISPEQAMGEADMDCRADIYSLGAMLYHLGTGKLMFQGEAESRVMELQVTSQVADPIDLSPELSGPMCQLIEKMLAKDPAFRHPSWAEVLVDIDRVKRGLAPTGEPLPAGVSTVKRSPARPKPRTAPRGRVPRHLSNRAVSGSRGCLVPLLAILLLVLAVVALWLANDRRGRAAGPPPGVAAVQSTDQAAEEARAQRLLSEARAWSAEHVQDYGEAIIRYRKVIAAAPNSKAAHRADEAIAWLGGKYQRQVDGVMADLKAQAEIWRRQSRFADAAQVYESYTGPMAEATKSDRMREAVMLRRLQAEYDEKQRALSQQHARAQRDVNLERRREASSARAKLLDQVAAELLSKGALPARAKLEGAIRANPGLIRHEEIVAARRLLDDARRGQEAILSSFRPQLGKTVTVRLKRGSVEGLVTAVDAKQVTIERGIASGATVPVVFCLDDLALRERLARMGSETSNGVVLLKGLLAAQSQAFDHALRYFEQLPDVLGDRLEKSCKPSEP